MSARPIYEREEDRERELQAAQTFAAAAGVQCMKTPRAYPIDFVCMKAQRLACWLEVKCRNIRSTDFPHLYLSAHKWDHGLRYVERYGRPFVVAYQLEDGLFAFVARVPVVVEVGYAGRADRADWQDMEPMALIPVNWMQRIAA